MKKSALAGSNRLAPVAPEPSKNGSDPIPEAAAATSNGTGQSKSKAKPQGVKITLKELEKVVATIRIIGDTPLITNQFSEKAKEQMRATQQKKAKQPREAKEPENDFRNSVYRMPNPKDGFGVPARAIKAAMVTAGNDVELVKTILKRCVRVMPVDGDPNDVDSLVKIEAPPILKPISQFDRQYGDVIAYEHKHGCYMREDAVRLAQGQADLRYRGCFPHWSATFQVMFIKRLLSVEQLYALIEVAGMAGLCEWRPSSPQNESGQFGCFHFDRNWDGLRVDTYAAS